jgi:hypothetical protein
LLVLAGGREGAHADRVAVGRGLGDRIGTDVATGDVRADPGDDLARVLVLLAGQARNQERSGRGPGQRTASVHENP